MELSASFCPPHEPNPESIPGAVGGKVGSVYVGVWEEEMKVSHGRRTRACRFLLPGMAGPMSGVDVVGAKNYM